MPKNKLRLSYSLIELWERGRVDDAINLYFHMDLPSSKAMEDGKRIHQDIAKHIEQYNSFPEWFFKANLLLPMPEKEVIISYNDMFDFKCVIDCLDIPLMYEFKTGVSDSLEWTRTNQIPLYFMALEKAKLSVDSAYLIHYNQHTKETDFTVVHKSKALIDKAENILDSVGPEIFSFFEKEGLI